MSSEARKRRRERPKEPWTEPREGGRTGLGDFEHNQWTFEGEVERLGAFAAGAQRAGGWKRSVAWLIAASFLLPIGIGLVLLVVR